MSFFGKNIRKIRNVKKLSQQSFAELFDLKRATLGAYEEERSEPRLETIINIANYFSITVDDLLTKELTINKLLKFKEDLAFSTSFYDSKLSSVPCLFPQLELEYLKNFNEESSTIDLPELKLPLPSTKKRLAFVVSNSEMAQKNNGVFPNDMVVGEWVPKEKIEQISTNSTVLAVTDKELILRKFDYRDGKLILTATNSGFDPIEIEKTEIREIWEVKQVFLNHIPLAESDLKGKLSHLEEEIENLKKYL